MVGEASGHPDDELEQIRQEIAAKKAARREKDRVSKARYLANPANRAKKTEEQRIRRQSDRITHNKKMKAYRDRVKLLAAGYNKPDRCECCDRQAPLQFDHNHKTDAFRGWLCQQCNCALGMVNDDIAVLQKLIDYLRSKHD